MVKLDGRGERVNNSLGASQFSRHLSLNRESRQPVCPSSSPLKHSTYTSVSYYNDCFMRYSASFREMEPSTRDVWGTRRRRE